MITAEQVREAIEENSWKEAFMLFEFNESSWQAIADELNELGSNAKPCYAADANYERCKYSVNRGWCDDAPFLVWDDTGHLFITMGGLKTWDVTDDAKKWFATLGAWTCHDKGGTDENGQQVFNCSECGCVLSLYDRDGTNTLCTGFIYDYPRYCPVCGRKVEG